MNTPQAKPYLSSIAPYVGGKTSSGSTSSNPLVKLSSNENSHGPSPKALEAYAQAAHTLHRYPQDGCLSLREAIGETHGFAPDQLICGAGSDEVLLMLTSAYAGVGDEVLYTQHAFAMYGIYAQAHGATTVIAPETNLTANVDALLERVTERTKLLFLANPNNPTGTYLPKTEIHRLRANLRDDIILVLDGAYAEYMTANDYSDGRELVASTNTVLTRTFSKIYGLPALRIGWGYGPKAIIDTLYKVRSPFNLTQPGMNAAIAALRDTDYLQQSIIHNTTQRAWMSEQVAALGLESLPTFANFILIRFPDKDGKRAADANRYLLSQNIIPREVTNYGLPDCLRITVGTEEENKMFVEALNNWCLSI